MREPTSDECTNRATLEDDGSRVSYATWYPQMGGYVGKAVVSYYRNRTSNSCFEVLVWHDGQFPFSEEDGMPAKLHHCLAEQFVTFGEEVKQRMGA